MDDEDRFCDVGDGVRLCYRQAGAPDGPPVVLIAGLSYDLTSWPPGLIAGLLDAGMRVIIFDNRDIGRSSRMPQPRRSPGGCSRPGRGARHTT